MAALICPRCDERVSPESLLAAVAGYSTATDSGSSLCPVCHAAVEFRVRPGRLELGYTYWAGSMHFEALSSAPIAGLRLVSEIGFIVSTAQAGSQAVMAIYTAEKGKVQNRIWQSPTGISTATTGNKTQAPNVEVSPGTYWLLLLTSANLNIKYHQPQSSDGRMMMMGQPAADTQDNSLNRVAYLPRGGFAVGAFPAQIASVPSFLNQDNEPHVWFRVS